MKTCVSTELSTSYLTMSLGASVDDGVYHLCRVPARGVGFSPPHRYFVTALERVGVLWGGGCVAVFDPAQQVPGGVCEMPRVGGGGGSTRFTQIHSC